MKHAVQVAETLRELQPSFEQRIVHPEDLHHATSPADSLAHMVSKAGCGQTSSLWQVQIGGAPTGRMHPQGGVSILGYGFDRNAADLFEGGTPQDCARSAEKRCIPQVVAV